ncbi:MAG TPA: polymer-forming cytoskeletal protein, partial [Thermoanaerobaculia bacterium]|nr:polymer-forming cytoskeletal protein [Thermoanaerobaculia bacterium]
MALFSKDQTPPPRPQPPAVTPPAAGGPATTYFGTNVTIDGTISGNEPVVVEGTVRGKINLNGDLRIGTQARVEATVHAKNVTVEGKVVGDISADDRLELVTNAAVDGNIKAPRIIVAEGAKFRGSVDMGSSRPKEEPAPAKAK